MALKWPPTAHVLAFISTFDPNDSNVPYSLIVASPDAHSLLFTRLRADKLLDLMAFHIQTASYETLLPGLAEQPQNINGTSRVLVRSRENGRFTVEIRDRDGTNPLRLVEGTDRIMRVEMSHPYIFNAQYTRCFAVHFQQGRTDYPAVRAVCTTKVIRMN